jgi:hypothetical protein
MAENPFDPNGQPPTLPQDLTQNPERSQSVDRDEEEEERRRAGRGSGGINPANASHSFNIRPDLGEGPAGLEVYTTIKSADYRANPDPEADVTDSNGGARENHNEPPREPSQDRHTASGGDTSRSPIDEFEADLAAAVAGAHEDDAQRDQPFRRESEESTKRQEAERAARNGEDLTGQAGSSAPDSLAVDLHAAEKAARPERESEGHESTLREQIDAVRNTIGGPGLF